MTEQFRFKGRATSSVLKADDADGGYYIVQLTIHDMPSEEYANKIRAIVEEAVTEKVRAVGGKLDGWTE